MRFRTDIQQKERRTLSLNEFLGVDYLNSPINVNPRRAVESLNLINKNGVNCKRNGWNEFIKITDDEGKECSINGIFKYMDYYIVHAGTKFFKVYDDGEGFKYVDITNNETKVYPSCFINSRSEAYLLNKKLYIIGAGDYLVYGSWDGEETYELRRVEDNEDTYIPTTTININKDGTEDDIRGILDMPNLLCSKRKNSLVGAGAGATWTLDASIEEGSEVSVVVKSYDNGQYTEKKYISNGVDLVDDSNVCGEVMYDLGKIKLNFDTKSEANMDNIEVTFTPKKYDNKYVYETKSPNDNIYWYEFYLNRKLEKGAVIEVFFYYLYKGKVYKIELSNKSSENKTRLCTTKTYFSHDDFYKIPKDTEFCSINYSGYGGIDRTHLRFYNDYKHESNCRFDLGVTVKYKAEDVGLTVTQEEKMITSDFINKCRFGTLFGLNGNTDRLFLSGNQEHPNMDFYSAVDDFTYFTDEQCAALGSENSPITGYARLSDNTLAIYKGEVDREASIYYRTGTIDEEYDSNGDLVEGRTIFPLSSGAIGETAISHYACANLAGDNLMLSKNGVFGVVLGENVASSERYAKSRSRLINERLCAHNDLSNAAAIVYDGRYYLAIDGVCYVADSRHKHQLSEDVDGSYNYEWWYLENIPARVWAVMNGKLCFGTEDGRICEFDNEYTDREHLVLGSGKISIGQDHSHLTFNESFKDSFSNFDTVRLKGMDLYTIYMDNKQKNEEKYIRKIENGRIYANKINEVYEGTVVYVDGLLNAEGDTSNDESEPSNKLKLFKPYIISDVNFGDESFSLKSIEGKLIDIENTGIRLHTKISEKDLVIIEKGDTSFKIRERGALKDVCISDYNGVTPGNGVNGELVADITRRKNIPTKWYTPVLDLGTHMAVKTLLGITVTADPQYNGEMTFSYFTKNVSDKWKSINDKWFTFDDINFENFTFAPKFASSYTVRLNRRNVNYVQFGFESENSDGCALNAFSLLYKINKNNRGLV